MELQVGDFVKWVDPYTSHTGYYLIVDRYQYTEEEATSTLKLVYHTSGDVPTFLRVWHVYTSKLYSFLAENKIQTLTDKETLSCLGRL